MDALITAAARALAGGDPIGALNRVALRDDPPALALRGIAMAQLGDFGRARVLLQRARRSFGRREALARARCTLAEAEVALASRDLGWPADAVDRARRTLEQHGDRANAAHAGYLEARRQLLIGHIDDAEATLARLDPADFPPPLVAIHELLTAGIALRRLQTRPARAALNRARQAAGESGIPALAGEVDNAFQVLESPAARRVSMGREAPVQLEEVEALFASDTLVVDACRYLVRHRDQVISLAGRPVLFTLARSLADAWPAEASRDTLIHRAFRLKPTDESLRVRLRVEMGRLRTALQPLANVSATGDGYALTPGGGQDVVLLAPPVDDRHGAVLALLMDGEAWSSASLAIALGTSQRTVQRALDALAQAGKVQAFGRGRARRWTTPSVPGFTTALLLPSPLPVH